MSLDRSLKTGGILVRHRNVLSRAERIESLTAKGRFNPESDDPFGLVKVGHRKVVTGNKAAKKKEEAAEAAEAGAEAAQ